MTFIQSRNIKDYKGLIKGLYEDFGSSFEHTMKIWCKGFDDGKYWQVWLVKDDRDKTIGICGLYSLDFSTNNLWLGWLGIVPKSRNKNLGKYVMEFLYSECLNVGCKNLYSWVDKNGKPLNFYYREGFKSIGSVKEYLEKKPKIDRSEFKNLKDHVIKKRLTSSRI